MLEFQEKKKLRKFIYSPLFLGLLLVAIIIVGRGTWGVFQKSKESRERLQASLAELETLQAREENISQEIGIQLQGQALRREQLADLVHQVWVNWMVCVLRITGSPDYRQSEQPARWGKQMTTKYRKLPADQKEYDRNIADAILLKLKGVNHEF